MNGDLTQEQRRRKQEEEEETKRRERERERESPGVTDGSKRQGLVESSFFFFLLFYIIFFSFQFLSSFSPGVSPLSESCFFFFSLTNAFLVFSDGSEVW